jgi:hypothetical protein
MQNIHGHFHQYVYPYWILSPLFNMLVLYWFGRIAGDLLGDHRMLPLYLFSGLSER